jgi:CPA2 family monovalent cation:H+ antiporter-2
MHSWDLIAAITLVLGMALVCGIAASRLKQNPIIGYLFAGVVLGPSGLNLLSKASPQLLELSELGVALLLFSVGLEFSFTRLRQIGSIAVFGGVAQVALTAAAAFPALRWIGLPAAEALLIGFAVSMSSTAVVIRVLAGRTELESQHGRNAVGILLLQDLAVVPLLILSQAMGAGEAAALQRLGATIVSGAALAAVLYGVTRFVLPRMLEQAAASSRDLPVVLAIASCLGAAWGAHAAGLSPAMGAFVAGILIAGSPFAEQVRADVTPLSSGFITIFFASIGALVDLRGWSDFGLIAAMTVGLMAAKAMVVFAVVWMFQRSASTAAATAMALCQVGEFTFVVADAGSKAGVISEASFRVMLGAAVMSLLITPYLIAAAPALAARLRGATGKASIQREGAVIVVGYGPAGEAVVARLQEAGLPVTVLDQNPAHAPPILFGDATQPENLLHAGLMRARALVCTVPDPQVARIITSQAKRLAPSVPVFARARYHLFAQGIAAAGARVVVDEEELVGGQLGSAVMEAIQPTPGAEPPQPLPPSPDDPSSRTTSTG